MKFTPCILALAGMASALTAQNLLLPDNHHLGESAVQAQSSGSTNWWGTTAAGRRFMVLYDAGHFTGKSGVATPIQITHLRFRGEDTEKNTGGQVYAGVSVHVYKTTLTSTTMASTTVFATNTTDPGTTSLMPGGLAYAHPNITVAASAGTSPNNYNIDLDLSTAGLALFDPTDVVGGANLLLEVSWTSYTAGPAIPPATALIAIVATQDTTAHGAGVRGRGIYATTPGALSGTATTSPPVIGVEFLGVGGYPTLIPATTEYIGASCGGAPSTFYQLFAQNQPFDLSGTSITLTPDNTTSPAFYTVTSGVLAPDTSKVNLVANSTGDDAVLASTPIGFTFNYPGGSTASFRPSTNGFIWLDVAQSASDFSPSVLEMLGNTAGTPHTARLMPFWHDFDGAENTVSHPGCGLHVFTDTLGGPGNTVTYVTWLNTSEFNVVAGGGQAVNTLQCVMYEATQVVEYRYGPMTLCTTSGTVTNVNGIVGFTRGRIAGVNSVDPQSRDLSHELPAGPFPPAFTTSPEGSVGNVSFTTASSPLAAGAVYGARMFGGQNVTFNVGNIPAAGLSVGLINLDIAASMPGIQFPGVTAPGCMMSTSLSPLIIGWESFLNISGPTFTGALPLLVDHAWLGVTVTGQAIGIDITGGPDLIVWASNTCKWTVGLD